MQLPEYILRYLYDKSECKKTFCILPTLNIYRRGLEQKVFLHSISIFFTVLSRMAPIEGVIEHLSLSEEGPEMCLV